MIIASVAWRALSSVHGVRCVACVAWRRCVARVAWRALRGVRCVACDARRAMRGVRCVACVAWRGVRCVACVAWCVVWRAMRGVCCVAWRGVACMAWRDGRALRDVTCVPLRGVACGVIYASVAEVDSRHTIIILQHNKRNNKTESRVWIWLDLIPTIFFIFTINLVNTYRLHFRFKYYRGVVLASTWYRNGRFAMVFKSCHPRSLIYLATCIACHQSSKH